MLKEKISKLPLSLFSQALINNFIQKSPNFRSLDVTPKTFKPKSARIF